MEIIIEIGSDEQKQLIEQELRVVELIEKELKPPIQLKQIIVASDFQAKINSMENIDTYKSVRGLGSSNINALGRIVKLNNGHAIVLSPQIYGDKYDLKTRFFVILHELHHLINKIVFPPIPNDPYVSGLYLNNLYNLYDEYTSDRYAFNMVDTLITSSSACWDAFVTLEVQGFLELISDPKYYNHIKNEIDSFRSHANIDEYFENTRSYYNEMALILVHTFSLSHHYPEEISSETLRVSQFVNDKTFALMDYLKSKSDSDDTNLNDGMNFIIDFMENFGVRFEQRSYGGYCHILDI